MEAQETQAVTFHPIGLVRSPFTEPRRTPIQTPGARGTEGTVEVFEPYARGLADLEGFSHIHLLFHFHLSRGWAPLVTPVVDTEKRGVFATRAPARPNGIGLSVVRLLGRSGRVLRVADLDIVDRTPLLDIKPYVPGFTEDDEIRLGWLGPNRHKLPRNRDQAVDLRSRAHRNRTPSAAEEAGS